jgi:hypothetical protein
MPAEAAVAGTANSSANLGPDWPVSLNTKVQDYLNATLIPRAVWECSPGTAPNCRG